MKLSSALHNFTVGWVKEVWRLKCVAEEICGLHFMQLLFLNSNFRFNPSQKNPLLLLAWWKLVINETFSIEILLALHCTGWLLKSREESRKAIIQISDFFILFFLIAFRTHQWLTGRNRKWENVSGSILGKMRDFRMNVQLRSREERNLCSNSVKLMHRCTVSTYMKLMKCNLNANMTFQCT